MQQLNAAYKSLLLAARNAGAAALGPRGATAQRRLTREEIDALIAALGTDSTVGPFSQRNRLELTFDWLRNYEERENQWQIRPAAAAALVMLVGPASLLVLDRIGVEVSQAIFVAGMLILMLAAACVAWMVHNRRRSTLSGDH